MLPPRISRFPLAINGKEIYDIVYLGNIIKIDTYESQQLLDNYLFVFATTEGSVTYEGKESSYASVKIDLVRDIEISYFNKWLQEKKAKFHSYKGGSLVLNEFAEIMEEKDDFSRSYYVSLKDQVFYKDGKPFLKKNMRIFLYKETDTKQFDNLSRVQLAPEFRAQLEYDRYERMEDNHMEGYYYLEGLIKQLNKNVDDNALNELLQLAKNKLEESKKIKAKAHDEYIQKLWNCGYRFRDI